MELNSNGDTLLFTGLLYQMVPFITRVTRFLEKLESTIFERFLGVYGRASRYTSFGALLSMNIKPDKNPYFNKVKNIAVILSSLRIDFIYREELDNYSGILLFDMGDDEKFREHATHVSQLLEKAKINRVITIDPHTTYALKILYPEYTDFDIEVVNYLEIILENLKGEKEANSEKHVDGVTIHDPCFYARYLEIIDQPREILKKIGYDHIEVKNSRRMTSCCGGPIESISPVFSHEIAKNRIAELKSSNYQTVTMCPVCIGNFERCGYSIRDISDLILKGIV